MPGLGPELLALLVCPVPECHAPLDLREPYLVCQRCGLRYPADERWPVLIPEEALPPERPADTP